MSTKPLYILHHIPPPPASTVAAGRRALFKPPFNAPATLDHSNPDPTSLFLTALHIRKVVFNDEQQCSMTLEIDAEDVQSHHWVIYSTLPSSPDLLQPAGTVRLVKANPAPAGVDVGPTGISSEEAEAMEKELTEGGKWGEADLSKSRIWDQKEVYVMIGRMANSKEFRGRGYGKVLIDGAIEYAQRHPEEFVRDNVDGTEKPKWRGLVCAHAQEDVLPFYRKCGFELDEGVPIWLEEDIRHVAVWKRVDVR